MAIDYENRKSIINHILDKEFMPLVLPKLLKFVDTLIEKRTIHLEWKKNFGFEIHQEKAVLDLNNELDLLSSKLCNVFKKTDGK